MQYRVFDNGRELKRGDSVKDFQGEDWIFEFVSRGPAAGKSALVVVKESNGNWLREFYAGVFSLEVKEV